MKKRIELYDDGIGAVEYVQHMGEDITVVNSARVSFGKEKKELDNKDLKLIRYLIRHKHTSTLEHNNVTFRFIVPLFIRSQHHRHRTWSYNEISRRYTAEKIRFYEPTGFRMQSKSNRQASTDELINPTVHTPKDGDVHKASQFLKEHHQASLLVYNKLIDSGISREQARGALPQNLYTEYYGTTNLNNLLKFIELRTHEGAQWEIRQLANACMQIAQDLWPLTVTAYKEIRHNSK